MSGLNLDPELERLVVCPVCHADLDFCPDDRRASCAQCQRDYSWANGCLDLIPNPPPDQHLATNWSLWEEVQHNGEISYTAAPSDNLSIGNREDASAFGRFAQLSGLVLDVGCGPQPFPSYCRDIDGALVGVDPLPGSLPREFTFVQAVGEYLFFPDATFDAVVFATSLDHVIWPHRVLTEARRVLKHDGRVLAWFGVLPQRRDDNPVPDSRGPWLRRLALAASIAREQGPLTLAKTATASIRRRRAAYTRDIRTPMGAADAFHLSHLDPEGALALLDSVGFHVVAVEWFDECNVFVRATASAADKDRTEPSGHRR